jgi:PKD repeat protein
MKKDKILIILITCMFITSLLPGIIGEQNENLNTFNERRFVDQKDLKGVYTQHGLEKTPGSRAKPVITVEITYPIQDQTVSGEVTITVDATKTPNILIDGTNVASGYSYLWDTTQYSDGIHEITATRQTVSDTITVNVDNGGGPTNIPPEASFTYSTNDLSVTFTDTSTDSDGYIISWNWDFEDGQTSTEQNPTYTYAIAGTYDVSLTVEDNASDTNTIVQAVTVTTGGGDVDKYALVIGISEYAEATDLQYCDEDADDWESFLQGYGYTVTKLVDHQATAENIETELINLIAAEDGDDYVVFAYSGHGSDSQYGSCIVTHDSWGMTHGYFEQIFDMAESQHIFFSFDACVIGDFQGLITNNRIGAFASNNRNSYDGDSSMQNGVFTYYQMEGWNSYYNFEDDSAYAVQQMKAWPPSPRIKVDPFYKDQYSGDMEP